MYFFYSNRYIFVHLYHFIFIAAINVRPEKHDMNKLFLAVGRKPHCLKRWTSLIIVLFFWLVWEIIGNNKNTKVPLKLIIANKHIYNYTNLECDLISII